MYNKYIIINKYMNESLIKFSWNRTEKIEQYLSSKPFLF